MSEGHNGYPTRNQYLWHNDSDKVKCKCGHIRRNHNSTYGVVGTGMRHYSSCKFCECKQFIDEDTKDDSK
jgi:hypothetical protein